MFVHIDFNITTKSEFKTNIKNREIYRQDVLGMEDCDNYITVRTITQIHKFANEKLCLHFNDVQGSNYKGQDPVCKTMMCSKNNLRLFNAMVKHDKRIMVMSLDNLLPMFCLFESIFTNIKFAGRLIWYANDRFVATVEGDEGLMLCDL